jgi:hypothetical protein
MLRWLLIPALWLTHSAVKAQISYGREDCGPVFGSWVEKIEAVKTSARTSYSQQTFALFKKWLDAAKLDLTEGKYKVLRRTEVTESRPLVSVLDVLATYNKTVGGEPMNYGDFFAYYDALSDKEKNYFKTLTFLFNVHFTEFEIAGIAGSGMSYADFQGISFNEYEADEYTKYAGILYKYLLDIVEDNRTADPEVLTAIYYEKFEPLIKGYTYVKPPPFSNKQAVRRYLEQFAAPLLYGIGRTILYDKSSRLYTTIPAYTGPLGGNRYSMDYHYNLFNTMYLTELENLVQHILEIKRNSCARAGINELGQLSVDVKNEALKPIPQADLGECKGEIPAGKACMMIVAKAANGRLLNDYDYNRFYLYANGSSEITLSVYANRYTFIPAGNYIIKLQSLLYDSMQLTIGAGETKLFEFLPKTTISVQLQKENGKIIPLNFRIDYLLMSKKNTYALDTVYCDVVRDGRKIEVHPGLYYVRPILPAYYFPAMTKADVTTYAHNLSTVTVAGYGALIVQSYDGLHAKKRMRVDIFTRNINSKTGTRTWLATFHTMTPSGKDFDTMRLAPGLYWVVMDYGFSIGREVEIGANNITIEPIETLGRLLVTNGTTSREIVEVTDLADNSKRQVYNNIAIDVQTDRKYHVKVLRSNGNKDYPNIEVRPGQQTTIRW